MPDGPVGDAVISGGPVLLPDGCGQPPRYRRPLSAGQRNQANAVSRRVDQAISQATIDPAAGPLDQVGALRLALDQAGYHDQVVRIARAGDPAVPGSLLYAVGDGPYCVLGYRVVAAGSSSERVDGRLLDGSCLPA